MKHRVHEWKDSNPRYIMLSVDQMRREVERVTGKTLKVKRWKPSEDICTMLLSDGEDTIKLSFHWTALMLDMDGFLNEVLRPAGLDKEPACTLKT